MWNISCQCVWVDVFLNYQLDSIFSNKFHIQKISCHFLSIDVFLNYQFYWISSNKFHKWNCFPSVCHLMSSYFTILTEFLQTCFTCEWFPPVCFTWCLHHFLRQVSHVKDFSPVRVTWCILKLPASLNFFRQVSHENDFPPVCVTWGLVKSPAWLKVSNKFHIGMVSPQCVSVNVFLNDRVYQIS